MSETIIHGKYRYNAKNKTNATKDDYVTMYFETSTDDVVLLEVPDANKDSESLIKGATLTDILSKLEMNAIANKLKRGKAYVVGDCSFSKKLPSWARLDCIQAGVSAPEEPNYGASPYEGQTVKDGTVVWMIHDVKHAVYAP